MSTENENTQPIITTEEPFIVKIKLLSNEVYEITTSPNTPVKEFRKLVQAKTQVPVERQRLVFSGKQLTDGTNIGDYVKESGLTIHLIARSQVPPENTQNTQQSQPQQQPTPPPQQQVPPQFRPMIPPPFGPPPPFNIFGMMAPPQPNPNAQQQPNQFAQNINSAVNTLMGNLGIRLVPPPSPPSASQQQNSQNNVQQQPSQTSNPTTPSQQQPQQQQPQMQIHSQRIQIPLNVPPPNNPLIFRPLEELQHRLNRINFPHEHYHLSPNPVDNTINFLRRLQNDMLRFVPQLSRSIQMLQEGRTSHLTDFIPIFEDLNASNMTAIQLIRALNLNELPPQHHHHRHQQPHVHNHLCTHNHPQPQQQPPQQPPQQQQQQQQQQQPAQQQNINSEMNIEGPEITATIVISDDQNGGQINVGITNSQNSPPFQPNIFDTLSNFLQPGSGSGFNFANLFAQQPQTAQNAQRPVQPPIVPPQQSNSQSENGQSNQNQNSRPQEVQQQQLPEQLPQQPQPQPQQQQQPQQPQQPQNPLGGLNIMSIFNNLQQSGGMGTLLGMSLGAMLEEEGQPTTVYSAILTPISGTEVLACFTQKDFSFIGRKRQQFREATLKAISVAGSREELVNKYSQDLEKMLIPEGSVRNEEVCRKRVSKILHKHIERVVGMFLDSSPELALTDMVMGELKTMYCESIEEISKHTESIDSVFSNIKQGFIQSFEQLIPGFSGLLYTIIERDLVRVYREYAAEKKRKQEMSAQQAQDQSDLLKRIQIEAKEDSEAMASFEHSEFYPH